MGFEYSLHKNYWSRNIQEENYKMIKKDLSDGYANHLDTKNIAFESSLLRKMMFNDTLVNMEDYDLLLRLPIHIKIKFLEEITVAHHHKEKAWDFFLLQINRGYWSYKVSIKHRNSYRYIKNQEIYVSSLSVFISKLINFRLDSKNILFRFVSGVGWGIGLMLGKIYTLFINKSAN